MNETSTPVMPGAVRSAPPMDLLPRPKRRILRGPMAWLPVIGGAWLVLSLFLWPDTPTSRATSMLLGMLLVGFGALALYKPWVTWILGVLALAVGVNALAVDHFVIATTINQLGIASVVLIAGLSLRNA